MNNSYQIVFNDNNFNNKVFSFINLWIHVQTYSKKIIFKRQKIKEILKQMWKIVTITEDNNNWVNKEDLWVIIIIAIKYLII